MSISLDISVLQSEDQGSSPHQEDFGDLKPIPDGKTPVKPFTPDMMPIKALQQFIYTNAKQCCVPPDLIGVPMMAALGGLIGNSMGVKPKQHDGHLEFPNAYALIIAPSGYRKTSSMRRAVQPLLNIDKKLGIEQKIKMHGVNGEESKDSDSSTKWRMLVLQDATMEALLVVLKDNPNGVVFFGDEIAFIFANMRKPGRESERQVYLSAWNGNLPFKQLRIARGLIEIPKACLSVIGGIQPSAILKNFDLKDDGDGMFQRFSFMCYPDLPDIDVVDEPTDQRIKTMYHNIADDLFRVTRDIKDKPLVVPFDQETTNAYLTWSNGLMRDVRSAVLPSVLISHIAKFPKMLCTVALITEILKNGLRNRCIGIESWRTALLWYDYERSQAMRVYSVKKTVQAKSASLLADRIRKGNLGKRFSYRDLFRKGWSGLTEGYDVKAALAILQKCNWIKLVQIGEHKAEVFLINPQLVKS